MAFPTQIKGIMYNRNTVNGPNRIPLDKAPNAGAIITGSNLYPLTLRADVISKVFTKMPTTICGWPTINGRKKEIVVYKIISKSSVL